MQQINKKGYNLTSTYYSLPKTTNYQRKRLLFMIFIFISTEVVSQAFNFEWKESLMLYFSPS